MKISTSVFQDAIKDFASRILLLTLKSIERDGDF